MGGYWHIAGLVKYQYKSSSNYSIILKKIGCKIQTNDILNNKKGGWVPAHSRTLSPLLIIILFISKQIKY